MSTIKKLEKRLKKLEAKVKHREEVTVIKSITMNWLSWLSIFIIIYFLADHYEKGVVTFFIIFFASYYLHVETHTKETFFTLLHRYHHNNNNLFSHISQCVLELCFPSFFLVVYAIFGTIILDKWIILFSTLFYSSIHNINYGYFHVNNVHRLHHTYFTTNLGPDLCDILYGTKQEGDPIENTNHYIPNAIMIAICILGLKQVCKDESWNRFFDKSVSCILISFVLFYVVASASIFYGFI